MKFLLDTCAFLWLVTGDTDHLSSAAENIFLNKNNPIYLSMASAWEISIKNSIGKLILDDPVYTFLNEQIESNNLLVMPIELSHIAKVSELPFHHKDPFDRLIIAQAIVEESTVLTSDSTFKKYGVKTKW